MGVLWVSFSPHREYWDRRRERARTHRRPCLTAMGVMKKSGIEDDPRGAQPHKAFLQDDTM